MKNKRLWMLLGAVLISAAFLLLNFRVAMSTTQSTKFIVTMGDDMPIPMQQNAKISLLLVGEGPLVRALQQALTIQMDPAGMGEIELGRELEPAYQDPVLVVKVGKPDPIWTPFFAMSKFPIHSGYATNGDTTFMEGIEETHTSIGNQDPSI